jgi:hypothetical protein
MYLYDRWRSITTVSDHTPNYVTKNGLLSHQKLSEVPQSSSTATKLLILSHCNKLSIFLPLPTHQVLLDVPLSAPVKGKEAKLTKLPYQQRAKTIFVMQMRTQVGMEYFMTFTVKKPLIDFHNKVSNKDMYK